MPELTQRQIEVLQLVAQGLTNRQIGERLYIGTKTVRNYITVLLRATGLENRTQLTLWAIREGIVSCNASAQ